MNGFDLAWSATAALGIFVVGLEFLCRWYLRRHTASHPLIPGTRIHMELDPAVNPHMKAEVRFEVSADGVRTDGGRRPPPGARRVLIAGGSAAEGYLLDWPDTWAGQLEQRLRAGVRKSPGAGNSVHVGSVGRSRTGSVGLEMIFRELLPRYGPLDGIVIMVGATDLVDWLEEGAPADWTPPPVRPEDVFPQRPDQSFRWTPRRSAIFESLKRLRNRWAPPIARRTRAGATLAKVRAMRAAAQEILTEVPPPTAMLARFRQHFESGLRLALAHARQVVVVRQPCFWKLHHTDEERAQFWSFAVGNPYHVPCTRYFDLQVVAENMELVNDAAEEIGNRLGAKVVDLLPHLERSRRTYYDFMHFTPLGAAQIGEVLARVYEGHPLPSPRNPAKGPI